MDSINQLAKSINTIKDTASYASKKYYKPPRVERGLDTFDDIIPFEMEFKTDAGEAASLSLNFRQPGPSTCCGTCYCSVCEQFTNNVTATLRYPYIPGTLNVFVGTSKDNAVRVTDYEELSPSEATVKLNTVNVYERICYIRAVPCPDLDIEEPPTECITDTFERDGTILGPSSGNGTGTAAVSDAGFIWHTQAEDAVVSGGKVILPVITNNNINYPGPLPSPLLDVKASLQTSVTLTASSLNYTYILLTSSSGAEIDILLNGLDQIETNIYNTDFDLVDTQIQPMPWSTTVNTRIRAEIIGNILNVYVWQVGDIEATTPIIIATHDIVSEVSYDGIALGGTSSGLNYDVYIDDLDIGGINQCTDCVQYIFDNFARSEVATSWGQASYGLDWHIHDRSNVSSTASVILGQGGRMTWGAGIGGGNISASTDAGGATAPWSSGTFVVTTIVDIPTESSNSFEIDLGVRSSLGTSFENDIGISKSGSSWTIWVEGGSEYEEITSLSFGTGEHYIKWEHSPGTASRVKMWAVGDPEPDWIVSRASISNGTIDASTRFGVNTSTGFGVGGPSANFNVDYSYFYFENCS